jgi:valyl-tRNA synthetase
VRRAKSEAKRSMRAGVARVVVADTPERLAALAPAAADVASAGVVTDLGTRAGDAFEVSVELAPAD